MTCRKVLCIILGCKSSLPYNCSNVVLTSQYFITYFLKIVNFSIIKTDENHSILTQQILCQFQSWIHHIQPVGMETAVAFGVLHHAVALFIELTAVGKILIRTLSKVILIHKVVAGVVRRINVDHLDFSEIGFLQQLQHFEVVALNIEVLCGVKVHAFLPAGTQRLIDRCVGKQNRLFLIRPSKLIALLITVHYLAGNLLHQHILINRPHNLAVFVNRFRHRIRKHRRQFLEILISLVRCLHSQFVHNFPSSFIFSISR